MHIMKHRGQYINIKLYFQVHTMTLRNQHIQKKSLILKSQVYPLANLDSPLKVN